MAVYALDSNIVIGLIEGKVPISRIKGEISKGSSIVIPFLAYYEVLRHWMYIGASAKITTFGNSIMKNGTVAYVDEEALNEALNIYVSLKMRSYTIPDADIIIAAIAKTRGYTLVTNDAHFGYINDLKLEDWIPPKI